MSPCSKRSNQRLDSTVLNDPSHPLPFLLQLFLRSNLLHSDLSLDTVCHIDNPTQRKTVSDQVLPELIHTTALDSSILLETAR